MSDATPTEGTLLCPYCKDMVPLLVPIESGMKLRLKDGAKMAEIPESVCTGCFQVMSKMASKGAALKAEAQAKENNRLHLWKNRVSLVKQGKQALAQKNFSDAALAFEKYLRILEIVNDVKPGQLNPNLFKDKTQAQELTVIASVYWDLMRIYDTHDRYRDRQNKSAERLAEFARFTPIFPHIIRKAESQSRNAKNPEAFKKFLRLSNSKRPRCFIATAAFDSQPSETVDALCRFRDERLKKSAAGRAFIYTYYRYSPPIAAFLDRHPSLKPAVRTMLKTVASTSFVRKNP